MNVELLRKVEAHILEEPKRLYMRSWIIRKSRLRRLVDTNGEVRDYPQCGTAACVAGWAVLLSHEETKDNKDDKFFVDQRMGKIDIYHEARTLLDIGTRQADTLFDPLNWPEAFKAGTRDDGSQLTAESAVQRIERFIETGGEE